VAERVGKGKGLAKLMRAQYLHGSKAAPTVWYEFLDADGVRVGPLTPWPRAVGSVFPDDSMGLPCRPIRYRVLSRDPGDGREADSSFLVRFRVERVSPERNRGR
jgi:hypothetical protein